MSDEKQTTDYFEGLEGYGTDFSSTEMNQAYLSVVQPGSTLATTHEVGTWVNSATGENYTNKVKVIPLACKTVWSERMTEHPYTTVGRYPPKGVEVRVERPRPGQRGFPRMFNAASGNEVQELLMYAVTLEDDPTCILYYTPTAGQMKMCKTWNSQMKAARLPNGKAAAICSYSWELELALVPNPKKPSEKTTVFYKVTRGLLVSDEVFNATVKALLPIAARTDVSLLLAPTEANAVELV